MNALSETPVMTRTIVLSVAILLTVTSVVYAGSIKGSVVNSETGQLLPGSQIHLYATGKDSTSRYFESESGTFTIVGIPPGEYCCFVSHPGYRRMLVPNVRVKVSGTVRIDFFLRFSTSSSDSTSPDVYVGTLESDFKMKYYSPDDKDYR
jgi:hypothetical protein